MDNCLVDAGSNPVAFARMEGNWIGCVHISFKKAKTAAWFTMHTVALSPLLLPGTSLNNIEHTNGGLISFPGALVIKNAAGDVVGMEDQQQ